VVACVKSVLQNRSKFLSSLYSVVVTNGFHQVSHKRRFAANLLTYNKKLERLKGKRDSFSVC